MADKRGGSGDDCVHPSRHPSGNSPFFVARPALVGLLGIAIVFEHQHVVDVDCDEFVESDVVAISAATGVSSRARLGARL